VRKIVSLFVDAGSKFEITSFTPEERRDLARGRLISFDDVRFNLIQKLSESAMLMHFVRTVSEEKRTANRESGSDLLESKAQIARFLKSEANIKQIITGLGGQDPTSVLLLRYIGIIDEYFAAKDKKEKLCIGRKLVSLFVQPGAKFEITSLPPATKLWLTAMQFDKLELIRQQAIDELMKSEEVRKALRVIE